MVRRHTFSVHLVRILLDLTLNLCILFSVFKMTSCAINKIAYIRSHSKKSLWLKIITHFIRLKSSLTVNYNTDLLALALGRTV